jgi:hypothetical protein
VYVFEDITAVMGKSRSSSPEVDATTLENIPVGKLPAGNIPVGKIPVGIITPD